MATPPKKDKTKRKTAVKKAIQYEKAAKTQHKMLRKDALPASQKRQIEKYQQVHPPI